MTDDWQESPRDEEVLQIAVTRANRAVFYRTPDADQTIGKILKPSGHEHTSIRSDKAAAEGVPPSSGRKRRGQRIQSPLCAEARQSAAVRSGPCVKLESVMAAEIANVNEGHFCTEHCCSPFSRKEPWPSRRTKNQPGTVCVEAVNELLARCRQLLEHQSCRCSESSSARQVSLNCLKGSSPFTARVCLLGCQVALLVSVQNGLYHFLGRSQNERRRAKPNAAQQTRRPVSVSENHQRCAGRRQPAAARSPR
jgi:hypothetical protein